MRIISDVTTVQGAQKSLMAHGHEPTAPNRITMRTHRYCDEPVYTELYTRTSSSVLNRNGGDRPLTAEMLLPCRRCAGCRSYRARVLAHSIENEISGAQRTWLLTFTMSLENQRIAGSAFPLSEDYRQAWVRAIQKYWKRVRKQSGAQMRYCVVLERHEGNGPAHGLYHAHAVLHEYATRIPAAILQGQWPYGNVDRRVVVDNYGRVGRYVSKYLLKDGTWVKTSRQYGDPVVIAKQNALSVAKRDGGEVLRSLGDPPCPSPGTLKGGSMEACSSEPAANGLYADARRRPARSSRPEETRLVEEGMADV